MSDLTAREWNRIICAVNAKQTAEEAGLKTEEELQRYRNIWNEAEELRPGVRAEGTSTGELTGLSSTTECTQTARKAGSAGHCILCLF